MTAPAPPREPGALSLADLIDRLESLRRDLGGAVPVVIRVGADLVDVAGAVVIADWYREGDPPAVRLVLEGDDDAD